MEAPSGSSEPKKLFRSKIDRIIAGVCGGFAEYFHIDPTVARVIWLVMLFMTKFWLGMFIYLACIVIIKDNPDQSFSDKKPQRTSLYWGAGLVLLGLVLLSSRWNWDLFYFHPFHWRFFRSWFSNWDRFWPVVLILFGAFYLFYAMRQGKETPSSPSGDASEMMQEPVSPGNATRLYRTRTEKIIAGVCGGLAKNLNIDPAIVRLVWVIFSLMSGVMIGIIIYIAWMVIVPEEPIVPSQAPMPATEPAEKVTKKPRGRTKKMTDQDRHESIE